MENKVIDLNNTWCKATEENFNALLKIDGVYGTWSFQDHLISGGECLFMEKDLEINSTDYDNLYEKLKQIHLVNGEFEYVTDTNVGEISKECKICGEPKNVCPSEDRCSYKIREETCCFKKYWFEVPEFECEILKEVNGNLIGYVMSKDKKSNNIYPYAFTWSKLGSCFDNEDNEIFRYSLTPLKKPWYEDESNFPCIICYDNGTSYYGVAEMYKNNVIYVNGDIKCPSECRPATEEEVLQLVIN